MLKPFSDLDTLTDMDFIDWGQEVNYVTEVGVGECAGVMLDLVDVLMFSAEEKLNWTVNQSAVKRRMNWLNAALPGLFRTCRYA